MSSEEDLATQSLLFPKGALIKGVEYRERAGLPGPRYNAKTIYAALKAPLFHGGARSIEAFHKTSTFSSRVEFFARFTRATGILNRIGSGSLLVVYARHSEDSPESNTARVNSGPSRLSSQRKFTNIFRSQDLL
jgi:hypothetical protein